MTLDRLEAQHSRRMVESLIHDSDLPVLVVRQIVEHSDGVPLFVEELTRAVLDTGLETQIPTTLQDTLTARLDQVGAAKRTAQLGAVMGRQFDDVLIRVVSPLDEEDLQQDLRQLVDSELLYRRGVGTDTTYRFKHALIQDAASGSLLRRTRQQIHQRIAQVLEIQFPETRETQPELLAHHYTEAGRTEQAVPYWKEAGQRANERAAHLEAIRHLRKGLDVVPDLTDTPARAQHELDLLIELGRSLMVTSGQGAEEVEQVYVRARMLCEQLEDTAKLFFVLFQLSRLYHSRAQHKESIELAEQVLAVGQLLHDAGGLLLAHKQLGNLRHYLGNLVASSVHLEQGIAFYDQLRSQGQIVPNSEEELAGLACYNHSAWDLWIRGYPDQARQRNDKALRLAQETESPIRLMFMLQMTSVPLKWLGNVDAIRERIETSIALCIEHGIVRYQAMGMTWHGWALAMQGQMAKGIEELREGLDAYRATGSVLDLPARLVLLAEACAQDGQIEAGLAALDEALMVINQTDERVQESNIYRLKGNLLLMSDGRRQMAESKAVTCFQQALKIARRQHAKSWELRAAMSLARLWQQQGKRQDAYDLLTPVYGWFTEGFNTADLQEAKALLSELS